MLAMDDQDIAGAEHWFRRAIQMKEDFRSALFNLALLLADDHRPLEAAPFLNQLVKLHPDHVKGLILLGDIYINNIKDLDAAENVSLMIHASNFVVMFPRVIIPTIILLGIKCSCH
jgi:tetratricopeptide (TPR) repeat protein